MILDIDEQNPLTPNHLLKLHPTQALPPVLTSKEDCYAKRRWLYVQFLVDQFWRRFSSEYFRMIISRQKWHKTKPNLKFGDVVLIVDESTPRSQWNLGKVASVCPDKYSVVRNVTVDIRGREIRFPIHKLFLIVPKKMKFPLRSLPVQILLQINFPKNGNCYQYVYKICCVNFLLRVCVNNRNYCGEEY